MGRDDPPNGVGRGEWYYPDGTPVPSPGGGNIIYRTRDHMVIRLNKKAGYVLVPTHRCVVPAYLPTKILLIAGQRT